MMLSLLLAACGNDPFEVVALELSTGEGSGTAETPSELETGPGVETDDEASESGETSEDGSEDPSEADSECVVGSEGCPCTEGGACDPGLSCLSEVCVDAGDDDDDATGTDPSDGDDDDDDETACDPDAAAECMAILNADVDWYRKDCRDEFKHKDEWSLGSCYQRACFFDHEHAFERFGMVDCYDAHCPESLATQRDHILCEGDAALEIAGDLRAFSKPFEACPGEDIQVAADAWKHAQGIGCDG